YPKFDLSLFAWAALVPLFYAIHGEPLARVARYAYLQGLSCYVGSMYWIVVPLTDFAQVRIEFALLPMLLLSAVMAVNTMGAIWSGEFIARRLRVPMVITMPLAWTAFEWLRTYFPIGFPWNLVGYTAYRNLEVIQLAEFTGVYGVSALILFFNAVIFTVVFRRGTRRLQVTSLATLTALMIVVFAFGTLRQMQLASAPAQGAMKVAMVQGNVSQSIKWDPSHLASSFGVYQEETAAAARRGAQLVVWPEAAAAFLFQPDDRYPAEVANYSSYRAALLELARQTHQPILFGAPAMGTGEGQVGFYNRAYLVTADGKVAGWYDKMQLVPFGEYVPARGLLGLFVNRVVEGFGDLIPGKRQTVFDLDGAKLGVLICYESVFPDLTRRAVKAGANVLVNITNDAWYGKSSAPYQALAMAAVRSAENKVPMIRAAQTGISAIILPTGEITAATPLFKRGTQIEDVSWRNSRTLYTRVGDLFSEVCFALTALGLLTGWRWPRRAKPLEAIVEQILSANGASR
ncbi:MAG: apolipoprotein N-acyltransferase, partial [Candidatus Binataceae bacterium]